MEYQNMQYDPHHKGSFAPSPENVDSEPKNDDYQYIRAEKYARKTSPEF